MDKKMKKALIFCSLVAAFLCLTQNANAQYATYLQRHRGSLMNERGTILTDAQVLDLVGDEIFNETYVGAKKQYKVGRKLVGGGAAGTIVGLALLGTGAVIVDQNTHYAEDGTTIIYDDEAKTDVGVVLALGGALMSSLSAAALAVGIPFSVIGKKRLNWIADNYNAGGNMTYRIGATPNGVGIALNF
jgi:hypothetical protein